MCYLFIYFCLQVFEELEEIGKTIQEEVLDAGMPVHGAMGGDISKCPYYAAKMGMTFVCVSQFTYVAICCHLLLQYLIVLPITVA